VSGRLLKVEGAGNDFLLGTGVWAERLATDAEVVRLLCRRRLGVGADGTLALFGDEPGVVRLVYRNSDGSEAAFCANGTRCAARAAVELLGLPASLVVRTAWAEVPAEVVGETVTLVLPAPPAAPATLELKTSQRTWRAWLLEVGVPHLVVPFEGSLGSLDLAAVAPPLRAHSQLGPGGANVSFVAAVGPGRLDVRSWERGVEAETLSCGSGVVAAALMWMPQAGGRRLVCATRSGQDLTVEAVGEPPVCSSRLTGPAHFIADITPL
jgi:diaminopimelate epimerase